MNKNSRLILISHELSRSGAPLLSFLAARYLQEVGYLMQVLCPVDGPLRQDYARLGIPVFIVPHILRDARVGVAWAEQAEGMLCNTILTWRSVFAAKAVGIPCYWWIHESRFGVKYAHQHPEVTEALSYATKVLFPTQHTASQYSRFSSGENYVPLLSGIEPPSVVSTGEQLFQKPADEFHLVCVATIEPRKGQDVLLQAIGLLPAEIARRTHLHLIGRSSIDKGFYRKIALRAMLMKNVHIHGELSPSQVWQFVQMADAFVLASRDEALPVSLLEAMALAKPIISSTAGGVGEVISSGSNGLLVEVENAKALMEAIKKLALDEAFRNELGRKAQQDFYARYTIEIMGSRLRQILEEEF
jgi:glycosyltransferase involved in cell wall biosynthesis